MNCEEARNILKSIGLDKKIKIAQNGTQVNIMPNALLAKRSDYQK